MARKLKEPIEVAKFGGNDKLANTKLNGHEHEVESIETQSQTSLESDQGVGNAAVIRMFQFAINPEVFQQHPPTKQDLFNAHYKNLEMALWRDGLKVIPEVNPRISMGKKHYRIWIGAAPMKGHLLHERPKTLTELAHG